MTTFDGKVNSDVNGAYNIIGKPILSWIFCVFLICLICIVPTAAEIPPIDKQITIGPIEGYHRYYIHIYNVDDIAKVKVNGQLIKTISLQQDSGWIEITDNLTDGDNTIELTEENLPESGWAYGFELKRDGSNIWSDSCGIAGSIGCEYNDITRGLVYRKIIALKLVTVSPTFIDTKIVLGPYEGNQRFYIRMQKDLDDTAKVKVNGKILATMSFKQDSGWIEITDALIEGENTIELTDENGPESGWAYGFELKRNDSTIWSDSCGRIGSIGCKDDDITRGLVYRNLITLKKATFSSSELAPVAEPTLIQTSTRTSISTSRHEDQSTNLVQKLVGILFISISAFILLKWIGKKVNTPKK